MGRNKTELWRDISHLAGDGIADAVLVELGKLDPEQRAAAEAIFRVGLRRDEAMTAFVAVLPHPQSFVHVLRREYGYWFVKLVGADIARAGLEAIRRHCT